MSFIILFCFVLSEIKSIEVEEVYDPRNHRDLAVPSDRIDLYEENGELPESWIFDPNGTLTPEGYKKHNNKIKEMKSDTKFDFFIVIVDKIRTDSEEFYDAVFDKYDCGGKKEKGMLIFLDVFNERFDLWSGKAVNKYISDSSYDKIIKKMKSPFDKKDYDEGFGVGLEEIYYKFEHPDYIKSIIIGSIIGGVFLILILAAVCFCVRELCYTTTAIINREGDSIISELDSNPDKIVFSPFCFLCLEKFDSGHIEKMERYATYLENHGVTRSAAVAEFASYAPAPAPAPPGYPQQPEMYPQQPGMYPQQAEMYPQQPGMNPGEYPTSGGATVLYPPPATILYSAPVNSGGGGVPGAMKGIMSSGEYAGTDWNASGLVETLQCGHQVHRQCMDLCIQTSQLCPICNAPNPRGPNQTIPQPITQAFLNSLKGRATQCDTDSSFYTSRGGGFYYGRHHRRCYMSHSRGYGHGHGGRSRSHGGGGGRRSGGGGHSGGHGRMPSPSHTFISSLTKDTESVAHAYNTSFGEAEMEGTTCYANALAVAVHMALTLKSGSMSGCSCTSACAPHPQPQLPLLSSPLSVPTCAAAAATTSLNNGSGDGKDGPKVTMETIRSRILAAFPDTHTNETAAHSRLTEKKQQGYTSGELFPAVEAWYGLRVREVSEDDARDLLCRLPTTSCNSSVKEEDDGPGHVVLASYWLPKKGWDRFDTFYDSNPTGVLTEAWVRALLKKEKKEGKAVIVAEEEEDMGEGHLVVLTAASSPSSTTSQLTFLNSWGRAWGDDGFFHVESTAALMALAGRTAVPAPFRSAFASVSSSSSSSSQSKSDWVRFFDLSY